MPDETRHESEDLQDYEVEDSYDTLAGEPGEDPLDAGVIPPQKWSAGMRFGTTAREQQEGESLDQMLAEEEPDIARETDEGQPDDVAGGQGSADEDIAGLRGDHGPDPRAGRLVAKNAGIGPAAEPDLVARDAGVDGDAASAEEAALHVVEAEDHDLGSE